MVDGSHTTEHIENSPEHWIAFTCVIESEVVKVETTVGIVQNILNCQPSLLKIFFLKPIVFSNLVILLHISGCFMTLKLE